jgi:DNA ligase D-like protein (predicted 3'-phosphoesterase)
VALPHAPGPFVQLDRDRGAVQVVCVGDLFEQRSQLLRGNVRGAAQDLTLRREQRGRRPAAQVVTRVDVGPLVDVRQEARLRQTPEPSDAPAEVEAQPRQALRFVVQMHRATRLHYDFRLEDDGVLKSWAIPKGPSFDTREKRLAMHVEDHPLDYRDFEGIIPKGNYGAGEVVVWDRGTYKLLEGTSTTEQIAKGSLKFELFGKKLHGRSRSCTSRAAAAKRTPGC